MWWKFESIRSKRKEENSLGMKKKIVCRFSFLIKVYSLVCSLMGLFMLFCMERLMNWFFFSGLESAGNFSVYLEFWDFLWNLNFRLEIELENLEARYQLREPDPPRIPTPVKNPAKSIINFPLYLKYFYVFLWHFPKNLNRKISQNSFIHLLLFMLQNGFSFIAFKKFYEFVNVNMGSQTI